MTNRNIRQPLLALGFSLLCTGAQAAGVEPAATQALDAMSAHLRSLQSFTVVTEDTRDQVLDSGQKLQSSSTITLDVRRPNGLFADIQSDTRSRRIYFDGKTFTLYAPTAKLYASAQTEASTVAGMLANVENKFGIEFPLADIFGWDKVNAAKLKEGRFVGVKKVNGQLASHYAFRQKGVDWQIWIAKEGAPLPVKYVITTLDVSGQPQYAVNLKWDTGAKFDGARFSFAPAKDDARIEIVALDEQPAAKPAKNK